MGLYQTEKICTAKKTITKTKRHPTEWRKIFANDMSDKGLIPQIYKTLIQFNTEETKQSS